MGSRTVRFHPLRLSCDFVLPKHISFYIMWTKFRLGELCATPLEVTGLLTLTEVSSKTRFLSLSPQNGISVLKKINNEVQTQIIMKSCKQFKIFNLCLGH